MAADIVDVVAAQAELEVVRAEREVFRLAADSEHPFLVQAHAVFQDEQRVYFVMEFIGGGDLMFHIQSSPFGAADCRFFAAQVLLVLEFLHARGVLYRDLKLDNILLGADGYVKLADYGLCRLGMGGACTTRTFCGTPEFMAPEILLDQPYALAVDFWAFGVLLYQMLECRSPFYGSTEKETFHAILAGRLAFAPDTDRAGRALVARLLVRSPAERLGCRPGEGWAAVRAHPFFDGIDWAALAAKQLPARIRPALRAPDDVSNFDEAFTLEPVVLTPQPSLTLPQDFDALAKARELFASF